MYLNHTQSSIKLYPLEKREAQHREDMHVQIITLYCVRMCSEAATLLVSHHHTFNKVSNESRSFNVYPTQGPIT